MNTVFLAQIDIAADNLDLVIYALLVIALLLALLTLWYWRHTKPRPVVIAPKAAAEPAPVVANDDESVLERALAEDYDPDSVWADSGPVTASASAASATAASTGAASAGAASAGVAKAAAGSQTAAHQAVSRQVSADDEPETMSADEWLAITGPDAQGDDTAT